MKGAGGNAGPLSVPPRLAGWAQMLARGSAATPSPRTAAGP